MAGTPSSISGARATHNILAARRVVDMAPKIILLEDDRKSLMTFAGALGTRDVSNPNFHWLTDEILPKSGTFGAGAASTVTTGFNMSGTSANVYLQVDDVVKVPSTGDVFLVTVVSGMGDVDLTHIYDSSASIANGSQWVRIGNSRQENSTLRDSSDALLALSTKEVSAANYTQTFRTALGLSRREDKSNLYGGKDRAYQRMKALLQHCEEINNAFWHGVSASDASGRTHTQGLLEYIPSGNEEAITTLTEAEFEDFVRRVTRYGNTKKRVLFCSRFVGQLISGWARDNQRIAVPGGKTKYGVQVVEYQAGSGATIDIVTDHALEGIPSATSTSGWDGYAVLVDPENVKKAVFGGDDAKLQIGLQMPDQDGLVDAYLSDVGIQSGHGSHHGTITGVTG